MKRAVVYARYSCSSQTERSIEGQIARCKSYAKTNSLEIIDTYIDRATSATTDNRPQFLKMVKDSKAHHFDCVLVYAIDRFARNTYDYNYYKKKLADNGVYLLSTTEQLEVNPDGTENLAGIIVEGMMSSYAYYYSRELSAKIRRGRDESMKKGTFLGGFISYGYKVVDKHIEIDEQDASIVREIFSMYADHYTTKEIVKYLNSIGATYRNGKPFSNNNVYMMLKSKRYIGITEYNGVEYTNFYPPIVEVETFEKVQHNFAHCKRHTKDHDNVTYLLTGKLYCGKCHAPMYGESGTSQNGTTFRYYKCFEAKHHKTCDKESIRKEYIEKLVITTTIEHLLTPSNRDILVKYILEEQEERRTKSPISILKRQLTEVTKKIANIVEAITQGIFSKTTKATLDSLEEEQSDLELRIEKCSIEDTLLTRPQIENWLGLFANTKLASDKTYQTMIDTFIDKIILYDDRVVIVYKKCGSDDSIPIADLESQLDPQKFDKSLSSSTKTDYGELRVYLGHFIAVIELD